MELLRCGPAAALLVALTACESASWPAQDGGTWAITSWSVDVTGATGSYADEVTDAGTVRFEGVGEWGESDLYWSGPEALRFDDGWQTLQAEAWGNWTMNHGDLWFVWGQNYADPEKIVIEEHDGDVVSGTSTFNEQWSGTTTVRAYTLTRVAP